MIATADIANCNWQDIDGGQTAIRICAFLESIGISVAVQPITASTLLTGMTVTNGGIVVDREQPCWSGDLLHEAGHIAVTPAEHRTKLSQVSNDSGEEMAAIAWSVAAAKSCSVPLDILFHAEGYKGGSESMIEAFSNGNGFGTPLLAWYGMTSEASFPEMTRWLR